MKKPVIIFYRLKNLKITKKIKEITQFLNQKKISSLIIDKKIEEKFPPSSLIVSLGGDGTYLKAVKFANGTPILGINMGSLGFLTPHSAQETLSCIQDFLQGQAKLKKNTFLKTDLYTYKNLKPEKQMSLKKTNPSKFLKLKQEKKTFQCVNDIVIERGSFNHLINLSIYINKEYIYSLKSDGIIISSPIGSTAYNLAAGGPILHNKVSSLVITPICSHSLTNRPIVIPNNLEIELILENTKAYLTVDGLTQCEISAHSRVLIKTDKKSFISVINKKHQDFTLLRKKLKFGQRD